MKKRKISKYREITLNAIQLMAFLAVTIFGKTKIFLEWGRGTGKSFILAFFMKKMVKQMPGAAFSLVGCTYQQILARTLPSTKQGLEVLGIYQDVDYVVGKCGDKYGFAMPFQSPDSWKNIIHFSNGCIFQLVGLDNPNSGRGLNIFGFLNDEAALSDEVRLYNNVKTTNRAKSKRFPKATLLGCEIYASSTPLTKKGRWFTDVEAKIKNKELKRSEKYIYLRASALINKMNLRSEWFDEMRDESPSDLIYNAEILNIRPKEILNGFYPQFSPKNLYTDYNNDYLVPLTEDYSKSDLNCKQDNDIDKGKRLILSIDWGLFLSAVVSQDLQTEYRALNEFFKEQPDIIDDLINEFCDYYEPLPKEQKRLYLYYGHDGNRQRDKSKETYGDEVVRLLKGRGWNVVDKSKGKPAAPHNSKYALINLMFKAVSKRYKPISINEHNCPNLIISLERAEATDGKNGIEKLKKDEKNASMKQQHTTHFSDAFDIPIYALFKHLLKGDKEHFDLHPQKD
ncbi:MAG: hypothetical protein WC389_00190 [Lutibacter sp.]|jgi:hypothetical protein